MAILGFVECVEDGAVDIAADENILGNCVRRIKIHRRWRRWARNRGGNTVLIVNI